MFIIIDTETTGLDTKTCEIIEIAVCQLGTNQIKEQLIKPLNPIPEEVIQITNITNQMVEDKSTLEEAISDVFELLQIDNSPIFIAHNADYDRKVLLNNFLRLGLDQSDLGFLDKSRWICTYRLSKKIFEDKPRIKSMKLSDMKNYLDLDVPESILAHRAGGDVLTCMKLFEYFQNNLSDLTLNEMIEFCWDSIDYKRFPFGKHKGKLLQHIPSDYFAWCLENIDSLKTTDENFDRDLFDSISNEIERRLAAFD